MITGCPSDRRKEIVDGLNFQYENCLQKKLSILVAYSEMVEKNPYRVLASYSYDVEEKSLRSDRVAAKPPNDYPSDVESNMEARSVSLPTHFKEISPLEEHSDFIQILINAKVAATCSSVDVPVCWRGYTSIVSQDLVMTTPNLRKELIVALQHLDHISEAEQKV